MTDEQAMEYIIKHCCPFYPNVDKTEWEQAMGVAIKALDDRRWIPVTERLPDESGDYCVTLLDGHVDIRHYLSTRGKFFTVMDVIAWMPLPKQYEWSETE